MTFVTFFYNLTFTFSSLTAMKFNCSVRN